MIGKEIYKEMIESELNKAEDSIIGSNSDSLFVKLMKVLKSKKNITIYGIPDPEFKKIYFNEPNYKVPKEDRDHTKLFMKDNNLVIVNRTNKITSDFINFYDYDQPLDESWSIGFSIEDRRNLFLAYLVMRHIDPDILDNVFDNLIDYTQIRCNRELETEKNLWRIIPSLRTQPDLKYLVKLKLSEIEGNSVLGIIYIPKFRVYLVRFNMIFNSSGYRDIFEHYVVKY